MGQWVGAQGRPKVSKISKACPNCDVTTRNPLENEKRFFRFQAEDLLNSWMVWITLSLNRLASHGQKSAGQYLGFCGRLRGRFRLELIIFFWNSSQLSVQFWDCRLLELSVQFWDCRLLQDCRLTVDCSSDTLWAICCRHNAASPWANQRKNRTNNPRHNSNWD